MTWIPLLCRCSICELEFEVLFAEQEAAEVLKKRGGPRCLFCSKPLDHDRQTSPGYVSKKGKAARWGLPMHRKRVS